MARTRRLGLLALLASAILGGTASTQDAFPNRAIRVIVPYPAGGIVDIVARSVTDQIGRELRMRRRHAAIEDVYRHATTASAAPIRRVERKLALVDSVQGE